MSYLSGIAFFCNISLALVRPAKRLNQKCLLLHLTRTCCDYSLSSYMHSTVSHHLQSVQAHSLRSIWIIFMSAAGAGAAFKEVIFIFMPNSQARYHNSSQGYKKEQWLWDKYCKKIYHSYRGAHTEQPPRRHWCGEPGCCGDRKSWLETTSRNREEIWRFAQ